MALSLPLNDYIVKYKDWVRVNPARVSDLETTFKWVSYVIAGRINSSVISTELVYALSNLLVFLNDRIIQSSTPHVNGPGEKLRSWLTVLEYSEVFIELSAKRTWGEKGRWILVGIIQALKCTVRLVLLLKYKERLVPTPAIPPVKRFHLTGREEVSSISFTLKRSGRVIRKVEAAPPNGIRLWKPPSARQDACNDYDEDNDTSQLRRMLAAEVLYIIRPVTHLVTSYRYGTTSWKPWLLSLSMDISSLALLKSKQRRSEHEVTEVSRRTLLLVLYLLRSPFYERYSANRVNSFLDTLSRVLPFARFLAGPVKTYIPLWQSTYSYVWST